MQVPRTPHEPIHLAGLNPEQRAAVEAEDGPHLRPNVNNV